MASGAVLVSSDGTSFDYFPLPENTQANRMIVGSEGIMIEASGLNGRPGIFSPDGEQWKLVNSPTNYIDHVFAVEDMFYTHDQGEFLVTRNGEIWWTIQTEQNQKSFYSDQICYSNGVFVAKGSEKYELYLSTDAIHWEIQNLNRSAKWEYLNLLDGRFFLWGRDRENSEPSTLLTSLDGRSWEPVNTGYPIWTSSDFAYQNKLFFVQYKSFDNRSVTIDVGPILDSPGFVIPEYMEFPIGKFVHYPLNVTGAYTSLKAYGLPPGLHFDSINGAIYGTSELEGHPSNEILFIGENNGVPGLVEDTHVLSWQQDGTIPTISTLCVSGEVGRPLSDQSISFWPQDHTSKVTFHGTPDWLTYDSHRFKGTPPASVDTTFTVEVTNLFGTASKVVRLVISKPLFERVTHIDGSPYDFYYFSYGKGRYFLRNNFVSYWSDDLVNWTHTAPKITGKGDIVQFKDHFYFVDAPRLYRSSDGQGWVPFEVPVLYNPRTDSVFASPDKLYVISNDKLVCSEDGLNWTVLESGDRPEYFKVTYQGDFFFAYWFEDRIYRSSDALTWELVFDEETDFLDILDIHYGNGVYLATLDDHENKYPILRSTDGANWERVEMPVEYPNDPTAILFADGRFHLSNFGGGYFRSSDGLSWETYNTPNDSSSPRIESFTWDGQYLYGATTGSGIYRRKGAIPPVVQPIHDVVYELGEPVDQEIDFEGNVSRVVIHDLPEGLSFDLASRKLVGAPLERGPFRACIVVYTGSTSSQAVEFVGNVVDSTKAPSFKENFHVAISGDFEVQIADYGAEYNGFQLSADPLPNQVDIHGFVMYGNNVPAGVYPLKFSLSAQDGETELSKDIPLYVSLAFHSPVREQSLHLRGKKGVPITESVMLNTTLNIVSVSGLPSGLAYSAESKLISGIPEASGEFLISIELQNQPMNFYYRLTIAEDLNLLQTVHGFFDTGQNKFTYTIALKDANGYEFRWFYNSFALTNDSNISGVNSPTLSLSNLEGRDPQKFSVELTLGGRKIKLRVPYKNSPEAYQAWATSNHLSGPAADPLAFGFGAGIANLFVFAQDGSGLGAIVPPQIIKTQGGFSFRFVANKLWSSGDWKILVNGNLKESVSEIEPIIIEEGESHRTWAAIVGHPNATKLFVSLRAELFETE